MLKKLFITACCSILLCLLITLWIVPELRLLRVEGTPHASSTAPSSEQPAQSRQSLPQTSAAAKPEVSSQAAYLVSEYEGNVAVFRQGEEKPFRTLDTPLSMLPQADQEMIREGIWVTNDAELLSLLEDYS